MAVEQGGSTASGVMMPPIIYGTAWKKEQTADLVEQAVSSGFGGIDTACQPKHYNEQLVGVALKRLQEKGIERETLFLQTKFTPLAGHDPQNIPYDKNVPLEQQVAQSFTVSLKNLQTEYVDSLLLHSPFGPYSALVSGWRAMEAIQQSGGARQLGICNCHDLGLLKALYDDAEVKPTIIQNRFYRETGFDVGLRRWCLEQGIVYQGFWVLTANPHILANPKVQTMAGKYGKTEAQLFFRYLNQLNVVPLTGTCSVHHMQQDLNVFDFVLTDEELELVSYLLT